MLDVVTASWVETRTEGALDGRGAPPEVITHFWIRTSPPARAWRSGNEQSWSHHVSEPQRTFHYDSERRSCQYFPGETGVNAPGLSKEVVWSPLGSPAPGYVVSPSDNAPIERTDISVTRWLAEWFKENWHVSSEVVTDDLTGQIVYKEVRQTAVETGRLAAVIISDGFVTNEPCPAWVFEPPAGVPVVIGRDEPVRDLVATTSANEREAIAAAIATSDDAWKRGDFGDFAAGWLFDFVSLVPRQETWKQRVLQQADRWSQWASTIESVSILNFVSGNDRSLGGPVGSGATEGLPGRCGADRSIGRVRGNVDRARHLLLSPLRALVSHCPLGISDRGDQ